jgi:hypothetical protein
MFKKTKLTSLKISRKSNIVSKCLENIVGDIHGGCTGICEKDKMCYSPIFSVLR